MKILALDTGDVWVGVAISDALGITSKPLTTIKIEDLETFLTKILTDEEISTVIVGYPLTLKGTESEQTKKIVALKDQLARTFEVVAGKKIAWLLWDERLSSKRAQSIQQKKLPLKEKKLQEHAIAAAFILQGYLDSQAHF